MRNTKIALARPFEGAPKINLAAIVGAAPSKPFLLRIPVTGERPISCHAEGLPNGISLNGQILSGTFPEAKDYEVTLICENAKGKCEKKIVFEIGEGKLLPTPLLGYTTWNAFGPDVTQKDVVDIAKKLTKLGITEYGYAYVNTDAGWQGKYGGKHDAVMPNHKFPDMKKMTDEIHKLGLRAGIYSTPMLTSWGCPKEFESIPGCTAGDPDPRFSDINGGIGMIRKEKNNVLQWAEWGFDYLKYDWKPTDTVNADLMRTELINSKREFAYCISVDAMYQYRNYWSHYVNSYRSNQDALGFWSNLLRVYESYFKFMEYNRKGHFFDLDMLDTGSCRCEVVKGELTEDEMIFAYTMRALLNSPIQISSTLEKLDDFELSLYCNDEIIAINQDTSFSLSLPILRENGIDVFEKKLADGSYAYAYFCIGDDSLTVSSDFESETVPRDVWAKEDLESCQNLTLNLAPHTVRVIKSKSKISSIYVK
ncbi:MAG: hypothetical protein IJE25_07305 [Clostridia bacterium]|nr:hypothetical protein [Clostridia bacterium]